MNITFLKIPTGRRQPSYSYLQAGPRNIPINNYQELTRKHEHVRPKKILFAIYMRSRRSAATGGVIEPFKKCSNYQPTARKRAREKTSSMSKAQEHCIVTSGRCMLMTGLVLFRFNTTSSFYIISGHFGHKNFGHLDADVINRFSETFYRISGRFRTYC